MHRFGWNSTIDIAVFFAWSQIEQKKIYAKSSKLFSFQNHNYVWLHRYFMMKYSQSIEQAAIGRFRHQAASTHVHLVFDITSSVYRLQHLFAIIFQLLVCSFRVCFYAIVLYLYRVWRWMVTSIVLYEYQTREQKQRAVYMWMRRREGERIGECEFIWERIEIKLKKQN